MERLMNILKDITESYSCVYDIEKLAGSDAIVISPDDIAGDITAMDDFAAYINSHGQLSKICKTECEIGEDLTDLIVYYESENLETENGKIYHICGDLTEN